MRRLATLLAALAVVAAGCGSTSAAPRATLVLDFTPNAAHAGIYTAVADRLDRAHGVRLVVRQPTATSDSLKLLAADRADLAIADIHDLGLARERGEDVVGVGALVQRPLAAVIANAAVRRPRQLEGRLVGVTGVPSDNAVLNAVVSGDHGNPALVRSVTIGFDAVASLIARKVTAATAFWNAEGVTLRQRGFPEREFRVDAYGAPPYPELVVVARRTAIRAHAALVRSALAAIAAGTRRALAQPARAVGALVAAGAGDRSLIAAELAALRPALSPPIALERGVLKRWAAFDVRFGILPRPIDVDRAFDLAVSNAAAAG